MHTFQLTAKGRQAEVGAFPLCLPTFFKKIHTIWESTFCLRYFTRKNQSDHYYLFLSTYTLKGNLSKSEHKIPEEQGLVLKLKEQGTHWF